MLGRPDFGVESAVPCSSRWLDVLSLQRVRREECQLVAYVLLVVHPPIFIQFALSHSAAFATGSLAFPESPSRGLMMRANSRGPTAAETVAALKASMGAMDVAGRAVGRPPSSPPPPPQQQQQPQVFQLDPDEEPGEMLGGWVWTYGCERI